MADISGETCKKIGLLNIKMETFCLTFKKDTTSKISKIKKTKHNRLVIISNFVICDKEKARFIKN